MGLLIRYFQDLSYQTVSITSFQSQLAEAVSTNFSPKFKFSTQLLLKLSEIREILDKSSILFDKLVDLSEKLWVKLNIWPTRKNVKKAWICRVLSRMMTYQTLIAKAQWFLLG